MKKLSLMIVLGFAVMLLNSCAADRSSEGFTQKATDTAGKSGIVDTENWDVYASTPYVISNNGVATTVSGINYDVFDPYYNAVRVSVSVWIKKDQTQAVLYVFSQLEDGSYSEVMMLSADVPNVSGTSLYTIFADSLGQASLNAMVSGTYLRNVNITMSGTTSGNFVTNGIFYKVVD